MDAESVYRNFTLPGTPTRGVIGSDLAADVTLHPTHLIHKVTGSAKIDTIELPYEGFAGFVILAFEGGASISTEGNVNAAFTAEPGSVAMLLWLPGATSWFGGTLAGAAETPAVTKAREDRLERERLRKEEEEEEKKKKLLHPDNELPEAGKPDLKPGLPDLTPGNPTQLPSPSPLPKRR